MFDFIVGWLFPADLLSNIPAMVALIGRLCGLLTVLLFFIELLVLEVVLVHRLLVKELRLNHSLSDDCNVYRNILLTNGFEADKIDCCLADKGVRDSLRN